MTDCDSPWKEAIEFYFEDFLQLLFPEGHGVVDWNSGYEYLDKELQQIVRDSELGRMDSARYSGVVPLDRLVDGSARRTGEKTRSRFGGH